jgi:hypothetical protein
MGERIREALFVLKQCMKEDKYYAYSWFANIAMTIEDCDVRREQAQEAAKRIMKLCYDVDMDEVIEIFKP